RARRPVPRAAARDPAARALRAGRLVARRGAGLRGRAAVARRGRRGRPGGPDRRGDARREDPRHRGRAARPLGALHRVRGEDLRGRGAAAGRRTGQDRRRGGRGVPARPARRSGPAYPVRGHRAPADLLLGEPRTGPRRRTADRLRRQDRAVHGGQLPRGRDRARARLCHPGRRRRLGRGAVGPGHRPGRRRSPADRGRTVYRHRRRGPDRPTRRDRRRARLDTDAADRRSNTVTTAEKLAELKAKLEQAREPGSARAIAKRDAAGKPSARARIESLLDKGSFVEFGALARTPGEGNPYGDAVVAGHGTLEGRPVAVFSHDQTVFGGTVGEMFGRKVVAVIDHAAKVGCPMIGINGSGGARVQDAVTSLAWYAEMGRAQEKLSGVVPQVSIMLGKCAGGAVYSPINTDVLVATEDAYMFVTGPDVIREVTGEEISLEELGGAAKQLEYGNLHHVAKDEEAAFQWV